jgi:hypothetical protein
MAQDIQFACENPEEGSEPPANCDIDVQGLVDAFKGGQGLGKLFKEYGKPSLKGVGHVYKELGMNPGKAKQELKDKPAKPEKAEKENKGKPEKSKKDKPEKPPKPEKPDKPDKPGKNK